MCALVEDADDDRRTAPDSRMVNTPALSQVLRLHSHLIADSHAAHKSDPNCAYRVIVFLSHMRQQSPQQQRRRSEHMRKSCAPHDLLCCEDIVSGCAGGDRPRRVRSHFRSRAKGFIGACAHVTHMCAMLPSRDDIPSGLAPCPSTSTDPVCERKKNQQKTLESTGLLQ